MIFNVIYTPAQSPSVLCPSVVDTNALNLDPDFGPIWIQGYTLNFEERNLKTVE